jgi:hypothetical protein
MTARRGNHQRRTSRRISLTAMLPLAKSPTERRIDLLSALERLAVAEQLSHLLLWGLSCVDFLYLRTVFINLHPPPAHNIYIHTASRVSLFGVLSLLTMGMLKLSVQCNSTNWPKLWTVQDLAKIAKIYIVPNISTRMFFLVF